MTSSAAAVSVEPRWGLPIDPTHCHTGTVFVQQLSQYMVTELNELVDGDALTRLQVAAQLRCRQFGGKRVV